MIRDLPALTDRPRMAIPKTGKAQRVLDLDAEDKREARAWEAAKKVVWTRDEGKCRCCKKRVNKSLEVTAKRGEVAHIRSRRYKATALDTRNLFLACHLCHCLIDEHVIVIVGTATFQIDGQDFINADEKLEFIRQ